MAENYCYIVDQKLVYAQKLPKSWSNVSGGFDKLSDEKLKSYGWLPMVEVHPSYNTVTHTRLRPIMDIQEDQVVFTDVIISFTEQELAQNIVNDSHSTIRHLEEGITPRLMRDAVLGITDGRNGRTGIQEIQRLEDLIEEQRVIIRG